MLSTEGSCFKEYFCIMAQKRKDGRIFNCYLAARIYDMLHDYCIKKGYTMTLVTEKAIEHYLKDKKADE